jgi:hypothetical protein
VTGQSDATADRGKLKTQMGRKAIVPMWVMKAGLTDGEFVIYTGLRSFADLDGDCWPSAATVATLTNKSAGTVRNAIQRFRQLDLLRSERRLRPDGGQTSNLYTLRDIPPEWIIDKMGGNPTTPPYTVEWSPLHPTV